jgi:hypothetical protein
VPKDRSPPALAAAQIVDAAIALADAERREASA